MSLAEDGGMVELVMAERHPELSADALTKIGNCYTFIMR
ncbi:hypothetical protein BH09ACT8_BH09ACT8_28960 [soil metagenome]